ncbi:MAG: four helix bundle protein [Candidatus Vogelbacteria bacterium]|nr:four helix bundle protein [Candidatus Vogelbacteria bacterium]
MPINQRLINIYKLWHGIRNHLPKNERAITTKVDSLFLETLETIFIAKYLDKTKKIPFVEKAIGKLDLLKFILQVSWQINILESKQYIALSIPLNETGRMLGGWKNKLLKETSPDYPAHKKAG